MNLKTWIPLVLAIALGLLAMKIASNVMSKNNPSVSDAGSKSIVVFKHDVTPGSKLTAEDLETAKIAGDINTQAVFNKPADLDGRVMFTAATKGTPVIDSMLTPVGTGGGLQALVPKGKRAITVEINEFTGIAGNLVPGCRVDVVSTINGENGEQVSRTVVQNVVVQSMGMRQAQANGDNPGPTRSVTLIATPREAESIELACATGKPRLVLRSAGDDENVSSSGVRLAELRHGGPGADPFQVMPADYLKPVDSSSSPTTQPTPVMETRPFRRGRQVKIIRGGVETDTVIEEIASPIGGHWMTNVESQELQTTK